MLKSLTLKVAGVGAAAVLASAATASPASAFFLRPCVQTGPQISEVVTDGWVGARRLPSYSVSGSCVIPDASVYVSFGDPGTGWSAPEIVVAASSTGTFSGAPVTVEPAGAAAETEGVAVFESTPSVWQIIGTFNITIPAAVRFFG